MAQANSSLFERESTRIAKENGFEVGFSTSIEKLRVNSDSESLSQEPAAYIKWAAARMVALALEERWPKWANRALLAAVLIIFFAAFMLRIYSMADWAFYCALSAAILPVGAAIASLVLNRIKMNKVATRLSEWGALVTPEIGEIAAKRGVNTKGLPKIQGCSAIATEPSKAPSEMPSASSSRSALRSQGPIPRPRRGWLALAVSALSLLVAVGGLIYSGVAVRQAERAYQQAAEQFTKSGAVLKITEVSVNTWNNEKLQWTGAHQRGHVLSPEEMTQPNVPYLIFTVANTGRLDTQIHGVGVTTAPGKLTSTTNVSCVTTKEPTVVTDCGSPVKLSIAASLQLYLPIANLSRDDITCNEFIRTNGLEVVVIMADKSVGARGPSGVSVATASFCPSIPAQPHS